MCDVHQFERLYYAVAVHAEGNRFAGSQCCALERQKHLDRSGVDLCMLMSRQLQDASCLLTTSCSSPA